MGIDVDYYKFVASLREKVTAEDVDELMELGESHEFWSVQVADLPKDMRLKLEKLLDDPSDDEQYVYLIFQ